MRSAVAARSVIWRALPWLLCCLAWAGQARAMELEGKTSYTWSAFVQNAYAGTCSRVLKKYGEDVGKGEVLGYYRLDTEARDSIRQALDDGPLRAKQAEARVLDARLAESRLKLNGLREAVAAGVESPAGLEVAAAELELLETQRRLAGEEIQNLSSRLADERVRIREELGGAAVSRDGIPREVPLPSPEAGIVAEQNIAPEMKLEKKFNCFRVAFKTLNVKCQVYAEDYARLKVGDKATVIIPQYPDRVFPATLIVLPLVPVDKGFAALSVYEVYFLVDAKDLFINEGVRAKVVLDK